MDIRPRKGWVAWWSMALAAYSGLLGHAIATGERDPMSMLSGLAFGWLVTQLGYELRRGERQDTE